MNNDEKKQELLKKYFKNNSYVNNDLNTVISILGIMEEYAEFVLNKK